MQTAAPPEVRTTCPYCGVGCGVIARRGGLGGVTVRGDPDHPANRGRLCSKGTALGDTIGLEGRCLTPRVDGVDSDWEAALSQVAARFSETIAQHGPESVAFYVSGQMLTEDYYVANKLMKGFIGSANIDTNSRLCMASTVAGHRRAFGTDTVPGNYEDLELADVVVLVGSNLAWCHPVLFQRIMAARAARPAMRIVTVDPRRTVTSDSAELHLAIAPGGDVALFNRLLAAIADRGAFAPDFVNFHVSGLSQALNAARADCGHTGLSDAEIDAFLALWIGTEKVVTVFSQGVNQSSSGTDKVNAILNCHLATGRIGRPGMGPFSVTGQPNAMGGREVGGMATTLACHMDVENADHRDAVQRFWDAPAMPQANGLKAVDMFKAVAEGRIKAIWIIGTNPVVSLPDADRVRDALARCDFVVVSDMFATTDTARLAHVLLPATGWGEKDGTVTNSDRTISRQRPFLPKPGQARHDWDILADVARRMGWPAAFDYAGPGDVFREHAALSGIAAGFGLDFDISGMGSQDYDSLVPHRWGPERFFGAGRFYHPGGKARMVPVSHRPPVAVPSPEFPLWLNTGRIRDQWHTMTRTGRSARLSQHLAEPFAEIHPDTAARAGIGPSSLVQVTSPTGAAIVRALISDRVRPDQVFVPMHWTRGSAPSGRVGPLLAAVIDPVSGQPESKAGIVRVAPYGPGFHAFAVTRADILPDTAYWARVRTDAGWRIELAGEVPGDWVAFAIGLFGPGDVTSVIDPARGIARVAVLRNGLLQGALFAGPGPVAVSRQYLSGLPGQVVPDVLSGRPGQGVADPGPTVCACFSVGLNTILSAIDTGGLTTVAQIGTALSAGTNCGSCRPEIAALLARSVHREAAE